MNNKTQSPLRFSLLCVFTWGLYEVFWFHRQWRWLKEKDGLKIWPVARAIFAFFFADALFKRVFELAEEKGDAPRTASWLSVAYIALLLTARLPFPWTMISLLSFIPMLPAVHALNFYWTRELPDAPAPEGFTVGEIVTLIIGGLFSALVIIGAFLPDAP